MMAVRMLVVNSRMVQMTVVPSAVARQTVHSVACKLIRTALQVNVVR